MFQGKFSIFGICKEFLENDCSIKSLKKEGEGFLVKLINDENGCYNIKDKEFSIKCVIEENFLQKFSSANKNIDINQLNSKEYFLIFFYNFSGFFEYKGL